MYFVSVHSDDTNFTDTKYKFLIIRLHINKILKSEGENCLFVEWGLTPLLYFYIRNKQ